MLQSKLLSIDREAEEQAAIMSVFSRSRCFLDSHYADFREQQVAERHRRAVQREQGAKLRLGQREATV